MSSKKKKKKKREAGGPMTAAGLIRFYEEADIGVKLKPHVVIVLTVIMIVTVVILRVLFP